MNIIKTHSFVAAAVLLSYVTSEMDAEASREIEFPNIPGYETLVCDLHSHSVFSDGSVWPNIRVEEAQKDGLDAISVTDHLEYQPHEHDIPHPDRNRSYHIAREALADSDDLLVINGAEVTRDMPPGHVNAVFITDANALLKDDPIEALHEANAQGAFVFWNHPNWIAQREDGVATLTDMHRQLIADGMLHGIEVVNEDTYSDEALQIALDNNLTIIAASDIHGLVDWQFDVANGGHRPVTLVFAKEKTATSLKEGLLAGRTVGWFNNTLIGRAEYLNPLIANSIQLKSAYYAYSHKGPSYVVSLQLENVSDASYILKNTSSYSLHSHADVVTLAAHSTTEVQVKVLEDLLSFDLHFEVLNAIVAPNMHPEITFRIPVTPPERPVEN